MMKTLDKFIEEEETLDPENWEDLITLGHNMLDDMMAFLKNIRKHQIAPVSEEVITKIQQPLPLKPQGYHDNASS